MIVSAQKGAKLQLHDGTPVIYHRPCLESGRHIVVVEPEGVKRVVTSEQLEPR